MHRPGGRLLLGMQVRGMLMALALIPLFPTQSFMAVACMWFLLLQHERCAWSIILSHAVLLLYLNTVLPHSYGRSCEG